MNVAGRELAAALSSWAHRDDVLVLALVRGGVPVAVEVARALAAPMDLVLRRGVLQRANNEAASAVSVAGTLVLDDELQNRPATPETPIDHFVADALAAFAHRVATCRGNRPPANVQGKTILLVDNGIKTGATMRVAIPALRALGTSRIVMAAPVCAPGAREEMESLADELVCLRWPEPFGHVGLWYRRFDVPSEERIGALFDELARVAV